MEYMLIIGVDESAQPPAPGDPGFPQMVDAWAQFTRGLLADGALVSGASLAPVATATTVRRAGDAVTITDGPFAESKEVLGGYYVVRANDLDAAIEYAKRVPIPFGSIEVRPIAMRPDESGTPAPVA